MEASPSGRVLASLTPYTRRWRLNRSALEGDEAPHGRIGEAVLPGFDVTRQPVFESRVLATVTMRSYQPKNSSSERPTPIRAGNSNK